MGSSCSTIQLSEAERLGLIYDSSKTTFLYGYGNGSTPTLGVVSIEIKIDKIEACINAYVVPTSVQEIPVILGRNFTEQPGILVIKDDDTLSFFQRSNPDLISIEPDHVEKKHILRIAKDFTLLPDHCGHIPVYNDEFEGDVYIESGIRHQPGQEYCVPRTIITLRKGKFSIVPCINLSNNLISFKRGKIFIRADQCTEEITPPESVNTVHEGSRQDLTLEEISVGPVDEQQKLRLLRLLNKYRECFASTLNELGCAKSTKMEIKLVENKPFSYRPYRMSSAQQNIVKEIVDDLLINNIIRESDSEYSSPILLVRKKNGEQRLCVDYRKLNAVTVKDSHPLPRIDDQIDKLQSGHYFISLDLKCGYHQVPLEESSKHFTAFVTPEGQYEYNNVPFGLTNAPRVFQRLMTKIFKPIRGNSAIYLDDVLLYAATVDEALNILKQALDILRQEGMTLNLKKCTFLQATVVYLGYEIGQGVVRPGAEKIKAVEEFPTPKTVHHIRQFLGLTGYFRHFVQDYALLAKPLTCLIKKSVAWKWSEEQEEAFQKLKNVLVSRPVLNIYSPNSSTEVHTDACQIGIAGILFQRDTEKRLHPVAYYSRQTTAPEQKYHSYELETLAVVETLRKFRTYLLGISFVVVTDCNSIKAASKKKQMIPRIARWWLELQEFTFEVQYRSGNRMNHVDALSRNPCEVAVMDQDEEKVCRIEEADWVLSAQLTDSKIKEIQQILSKPPKTEYDKHVYKNYCLRNSRVYRITARGLLWLVPKGMRQRIVRAAHDDFGHFGTERTLRRLCESYWFPRMRNYVEQYISCCIACLFYKKNSGKKEGYLHPIPKGVEPLNTLHVDHLGPFPKSKRNNMYLIVGIDGFTKFVFLRAVRDTKTKYVIDYFKDIFATYGVPKVLVADRGSSYTSKKFTSFCKQNNVRLILNAVATPRANGQVERLNRTILAALLPSVPEEELWDEQVRDIQFALNNVVNKSTGKTPSQLMFGYTPRNSTDSLLLDEVKEIPAIIEDLVSARLEAAEKIRTSQRKQKQYYDRKRKEPRKYKEGDLVLVQKQVPSTGTSRKLVAPYDGPMVVKTVLPNDRYIVRDMNDSYRTLRSSKYENVVAVDRMRPWCVPGGVSDDTDSESGEDDVVLSSEDDNQKEDSTK